MIQKNFNFDNDRESSVIRDSQPNLGVPPILVR